MMKRPKGMITRAEVLADIRQQVTNISPVPSIDFTPEDAVICACLTNSDAFAQVSDVLVVDAFQNSVLGKVWAAMAALYGRSQPIDIITVRDELTQRGDLDKIGGPAGLVSMAGGMSSGRNLVNHAKIVARSALRRDLNTFAGEIYVKAQDKKNKIEEVIEEAERELYRLSAAHSHDMDSMEVGALATATLLAIEKIDPSAPFTGIPTGFAELNKITHGWQDSDFIILAARPSMGKTALSLAMAKAAADNYKKVAYISLEQSKKKLMVRLLASHAEIKADSLRNNAMSDEERLRLLRAAEYFQSIPMHVIDPPQATLMQIRSKCRALKMKEGIDIVFIDYLGLIRHDSGKRNREQDVSEVSAGLKAMAKELEVPVIALSQLSRAVEKRGGTKRPQLSDLRDSGSLEQDADIVAFLYRAAHYGIMEDEEGYSTENHADVIIAKHRDGQLKDIRVKFEAKYVKFSDFPETSAETAYIPF